MAVNMESVMFSLDIDSVFESVSLRKDNRKVPFAELIKRIK